MVKYADFFGSTTQDEFDEGYYNIARKEALDDLNKFIKDDSSIISIIQDESYYVDSHNKYVHCVFLQVYYKG